MAFDTTAKLFPPPKAAGYAFVPTLEMGGVEISTTGGAYTHQSGLAHFIAPGLVWLGLRVELSAKGTGSGACRVRWPAAAADGTPLPPSNMRLGVGTETINIATATIDQITASILTGGSVVELYRRIGATSAALNAADITNTFVFRVGMVVPYAI